jgi:transglutaminase-like putative cysteine protease
MASCPRDSEYLTEYLQPTGLCDFDRHPEIRARALELTVQCGSNAESFHHLFSFVRELPYGLEDWDVTASETLAKGWGMCAGKANLLVALLRCSLIPARYRVYRIRAEANLWTKATEKQELAEKMGPAPSEQDHVDCEVWLDEWVPCDPARDTAFERGMIALGIPLERHPVAGAAGRSPYLYLASFDDWARQRQARRQFRANRNETFAAVNEQLWKIRELGRGEEGAPPT